MPTWVHRLLWLITCGLLLAACHGTSEALPTTRSTTGASSVQATDTSSSISPSDWQRLRRPLQLPSVASGRACPVTPVQDIAPRAFAPGAGHGPVYAIGVVNDVRISNLQPGVYKTLWVARKTYAGPVLVRGRQLDGPAALAFTHSGDPQETEMRLNASEASSPNADDWRQWPSLTVVPGPGCYGLQVDGDSFTDVIVFAVRT